MLVFDIDHFKRVNDDYGHQIGDQALLQVCQTARQFLRPSDLLARFGGDEFVVLLPDTQAELAAAIAERILAQLPFMPLADVVAVTASFGVTQWQPGERYTALFERADNALYQAKQRGRHQVVVL